ncbi:MAG: 50S ribosomal protein L24 [Minisyncoccales bacterium]
MKIKRGDEVLVISGKWKGKSGKVLKCFPVQGKIIVQGINLIKKHRKKTKGTEKSEIITQEAPIFISKVKLICPRCKKGTRVGYQFKQGKKVRVCKKCLTTI